MKKVILIMVAVTLSACAYAQTKTVEVKDGVAIEKVAAVTIPEKVTTLTPQQVAMKVQQLQFQLKSDSLQVTRAKEKLAADLADYKKYNDALKDLPKVEVGKSSPAIKIK